MRHTWTASGAAPTWPAVLKVARSTATPWAYPGLAARPVADPAHVAHRARRNTVVGSRRNIRAHYDLGNDFYRLFLDETLTYSSAVFASADQSLADAQRNKYRIMPSEPASSAACTCSRSAVAGVASRSTPRPARLPRDFDHRLHGAARAGHARASGPPAWRIGRAVELRDYREIDGSYDAIVSIEMLEAVGAEYYDAFFAACDACPGRRQDEPPVDRFPDAATSRSGRGANWIQQYIFPGGLLPSLAAIERSLQARLLVRSVRHPRRTTFALSRRGGHFMSRLARVRTMGFDERFIRMWEYTTSR